MTAFATRDTIEQVELGNELAPRFDSDGLLPAIVVDAATKEILMLGYMNAEALDRTMTTRETHFWSRSRKALWRKGEHSGFAQKVEQLLVDDDQDAIILHVRIDGPGSCQVGFRSCFYREITPPAPYLNLCHGNAWFGSYGHFPTSRNARTGSVRTVRTDQAHSNENG